MYETDAVAVSAGADDADDAAAAATRAPPSVRQLVNGNEDVCGESEVARSVALALTVAVAVSQCPVAVAVATVSRLRLGVDCCLGFLKRS